MQMVSISAAILAFLGISIFAASEIYVGYELNDTGGYSPSCVLHCVRHELTSDHLMCFPLLQVTSTHGPCYGLAGYRSSLASWS